MDCPRQGRVHARANIEVGAGQCHSLMGLGLPGQVRQNTRRARRATLPQAGLGPIFGLEQVTHAALDGQDLNQDRLFAGGLAEPSRRQAPPRP